MPTSKPIGANIRKANWHNRRLCLRSPLATEVGELGRPNEVHFCAVLTGLSALLQTARKSRLTSWGGNSASSCFDDAVSIAGDDVH